MALFDRELQYDRFLLAYGIEEDGPVDPISDKAVAEVVERFLADVFMLTNDTTEETVDYSGAIAIVSAKGADIVRGTMGLNQ